jgi:hypothetical protein
MSGVVLGPEWPPAPPRKEKFYGRVWFWLLVVVLVIAILRFDDGHALNQVHDAVYDVSGTGTAEITQHENGHKLFTTREPLTESSPAAELGSFGGSAVSELDVVAQLESGTSVACWLRVGNQVASHSSTGQHAIVKCSWQGPSFWARLIP